MSTNSKLIFGETIFPHLGRASKSAGFFLFDTFHEHDIDLSREQWLVLKMLHEKEGQSQNDLAFITNRSKTSLTRLINTMEKKKLVFRKHSKVDKRINHIYLTDSGKSIFSKSLPIIKEFYPKVIKGIDKKELECTIKVLNQITNNIKNISFR